jgi:cytochrome P450
MTMLNPLIWGEDADDVDPTRWDHLSGDSLNPYAFNAFSNGPRICIGRAFAFIEIKLILVEMIRNFRFLSIEKAFTVENPNLTLMSCLVPAVGVSVSAKTSTADLYAGR